MKYLLIAVLAMMSTLNVDAHYLNKLCWNNGKYSFNATNGSNGTATIRVYSDSNYTVQIQQFNVNVTGGNMTFEVNQPIRTTIVYVKVKWNGDNYTNQSSSGTNQCTIVPIKFDYLNLIQLDANTILVNFRVVESEGEDRFNVQFSTDGINFKNVAIIFPSAIIPKQEYSIKIKM